MRLSVETKLVVDFPWGKSILACAIVIGSHVNREFMANFKDIQHTCQVMKHRVLQLNSRYKFFFGKNNWKNFSVILTVSFSIF